MYFAGGRPKSGTRHLLLCDDQSGDIIGVPLWLATGPCLGLHYASTYCLLLRGSCRPSQLTTEGHKTHGEGWQGWFVQTERLSYQTHGEGWKLKFVHSITTNLKTNLWRRVKKTTFTYSNDGIWYKMYVS